MTSYGQIFEPYMRPGEEFIGWLSVTTYEEELSENRLTTRKVFGGIGGILELFNPLMWILCLLAMLFPDKKMADYRIGVTDKGLHFLNVKTDGGKKGAPAFFEHVLISKFVASETDRHYEILIDFKFGESMTLYLTKKQWSKLGQERPVAEIFHYIEERVSGALPA